MRCSSCDFQSFQANEALLTWHCKIDHDFRRRAAVLHRWSLQQGCTLEEEVSTMHGTINWMAPEVITCRRGPMPGSEGYKKDGPAMVMVSKRWIYVRVCIGRVTVM